MSDTHILIGKELRYAAEHCGTGTSVVDLSAYTLDEITDPIVKRMIDEFRQLYAFRIDHATRFVTVEWRPQAMDHKAHASHGPTTRLTRRR